MSGKEESVTNPEWIEADIGTREPLSDASDQPFANTASTVGGYDVNVAGVRMIGGRRRIREREHAEFIICTKRLGKEDVYVARRYGAFKKLYHDVC